MQKKERSKERKNAKAREIKREENAKERVIKREEKAKECQSSSQQSENGTESIFLSFQSLAIINFSLSVRV